MQGQHKTTRPSLNKGKCAVCVMQIFPCYELFYHLNILKIFKKFELKNSLKLVSAFKPTSAFKPINCGVSTELGEPPFFCCIN
jgi:hypothetical protein